METVFKVVLKHDTKLLSCTVANSDFVIDYKKPVLSDYGMFVFPYPYWAKKFVQDYKHFRIIKGITSETIPLTWCLERVTPEEHRIFWDFYFQHNKLATNTQMMKMGLYPYLAPYGTSICFDFQMVNRFVNIEEEIDIYERRKDADRETERS